MSSVKIGYLHGGVGEQLESGRSSESCHHAVSALKLYRCLFLVKNQADECSLFEIKTTKYKGQINVNGRIANSIGVGRQTARNKEGQSRAADVLPVSRTKYG